jgi:hypothetical protein
VTPPAPPTTNQSYWGTVGNDIITGVDVANQIDRLSGALSTGTTPESIGRGQIDTLIGNVGVDVFLLGDKRGVFYNDGNATNLGTNDYAIIKNFKVGEDKLQVRSAVGGYLTEVINGDMYFYQDNWNNVLDKNGPKFDELIAVLEGVTSIGNNEYIGVR